MAKLGPTSVAGSISINGQIISLPTTGTAPFVVSSTTEVENLRAATATKIASIGTTFSGTYPLVINASGVLYSNANATFNGTTNTLTANLSATTITLLDNAHVNFGTGTDVEFHFDGSQFNTDLNSDYDWAIRDGNSSNAVRFKFDISTGYFYSNRLAGSNDGDTFIDWGAANTLDVYAGGTLVSSFDANGIKAGTSTIRGGAKFTYSGGVLTIDVT